MGTLNVTSTSNGIMEQLRSALSDQVQRDCAV